MIHGMNNFDFSRQDSKIISVSYSAIVKLLVIQKQTQFRYDLALKEPKKIQKCHKIGKDVKKFFQSDNFDVSCVQRE